MNPRWVAGLVIFLVFEPDSPEALEQEPQSTNIGRDETGSVSWSVHCNFTGEGKCNERGWACTPHPHQPGLILPSSLNVRQKAAVATLCTLWQEHIHTVRFPIKVLSSKMNLAESGPI